MSGRALVCAPLPPEFDRESGSRRIYHTIELLREAGWDVTFVCKSAGEGGRHLSHLRQLGVGTWVGFGEDTRALVAGGGFDVVVFAFWHLARDYMPMVRELSPRSRIVVDSIDIHWLRRIRAGFGGGADRIDGRVGSELVGELNTYAAADAVLTVSEREALLLDDLLCRPGFARAVPDSDELDPSPIERADRHGILFVGNFRHPPNLDAVEWFCSEVLPRLGARTRARHPVRIVGNGLDGRVRDATRGCPDVELVGWVPSLTPYLHHARMTVVPLRYGAGTKRKLIQALLAGTPTVSTGVGTEGLDLDPDRHVVRADDAADFAAGIERLLDDDDLWDRLAVSGRRRMLRLRSRKAQREGLLSAIEDVLAAPRVALVTSGASPAVAAPDRREASVESLREAVARSVPSGSSVLVVSKGDPALLALDGAVARHFPSDESGEYAGYHPRDSAQAIGWLESRTDSTHLVVPRSAFWWLEYYGEFGRHLAERHERVWCDESCLIYRLRSA